MAVDQLLSGLGADELFGGYPSFHDVPRLMWLARFPRPVKKAFRLLGASGAIPNTTILQ